MEFQCTVHLLVGGIGLRPRPSTYLLGEGFRLRIIQLRLRRKLLRRRDEIPFSIVEKTIPIQCSMSTLSHRPVVCGMPCALVLFNNIKLGLLQVVIFIIIQITRHSIRNSSCTNCNITCFMELSLCCLSYAPMIAADGYNLAASC